MKSSLDENDLCSTTTTKGKTKLQVKENNYSLNNIGKLCMGHDVTVSNTMIKITYKKALKDKNAVVNAVDCNSDLDFNIRKSKPHKSINLSSDAVSFIMKTPKLDSKSNSHMQFHSTPKKPESEKKKKYVNGTNLSTTPNNPGGKNSLGRAQKTSSSQENGSLSSKKQKEITNKQSSETVKKFLKGKPKANIIHKNNTDTKKTKLAKGKDKKEKKLENGVKKASGVDEKIKKIGGLKRRATNTETNSLTKVKKIKISENEVKEGEDRSSSEEINKNIGKKQIMLVDPELPSGWTRFIRTKNEGSPNEQHVVYVVNPQGKKFRFKWKLRKYLKRTNSTLDADQFFFGLYQRPKPSNSSAEEEKSKNSTASEIPSNDSRSEASPEPDHEEEDSGANAVESSRNSDTREILTFDPDLPFGWKRVIHSYGGDRRKQVHIISPDGKIFRRRYRLHEYLVKHQYNHSLDRFYFGLYPRKERSSLENAGKETEGKADSGSMEDSAVIYNKTKEPDKGTETKNDSNESVGGTKADLPNSPMYDDPYLPEGWKRFIKIRSCGESAGRMEVVIVSPDGRRHRSKKHLDHYLRQKQLNYKAGDFDFTVFGRSNQKRRLPLTSTREAEPGSSESSDVTLSGGKKKPGDKPVPEIDAKSSKESSFTREGRLINTVNGLMMCSGLSSARNERRQRLPKGEHEKQLKSYLNSQNFSWDGSDIPTSWVQKLIKCRTDFKNLEPDAVTTVAEVTKDFIKKVSVRALAGSNQPGNGLRYDDVAELVDRTSGLSFLKVIIPKKITFREYVKLNRPKKFLSFT